MSDNDEIAKRSTGHIGQREEFAQQVEQSLKEYQSRTVLEPMKGFFRDLDWDACNPYTAGKFATGGTVSLTEQSVLGETVSEQTIPKDSDLYRRMIEYQNRAITEALSNPRRGISCVWGLVGNAISTRSRSRRC